MQAFGEGQVWKILRSGNPISDYLRVMSNELASPKVLVCPADKGRKMATNFWSLRDINISYLLCLDAKADGDPGMWLAADWNITNNRNISIRSVLLVPTNSAVGWTDTLHKKNGNVLLVDGSVQQFSNSKLNASLRSLTNSPLRLAIPQ